MRLSERIAKGIGIDESYVTIIASRNNLYAKYYIPKKNGRYRLILQPSKELKVLQRWLLRNIFAYFPVSEYSSAYSKGNSVRKNAAVHKEGRYLLHTDITNFFPTISRTMLKQYFQSNESLTRKLGMADEDIELVGFTHSGGDLAKKIESFKKKGVTTVHLSTCTRGKNENYESIAEQCAEAGFDVVGYTHGAAVSKDGKEAVVLSAKPVEE